MALDKYKKMRDFGVTPEPEGRVEPSKGRLRFVIQKHDASHLHYDFRLEMEGVLKSWAVPKGPSLNPKDKRLAMMTEDHPMSYRTFEGIIPAGNYGGGEVIVWDLGTYREASDEKRAMSTKEEERRLLAGLHQGSIKFFLEGEKLKGAWTLIKIKHSRDGKDNSWLLIKEKDEYVSASRVVAEEVESVLSDRVLTRDGGKSFGPGSPRWESGKEIAAKKGDTAKVKNSHRLAGRHGKYKRGKDKMPHDVKPMLATLVDAPFNRKEWLFEIKFDGYRAVAEVKDSKVALYSRNGNSFNDNYPPVVQALETLGHDAVLDGEVVVVDEKGKSQFQYLQHYGDKQKAPASKGALLYYVFDILYLDGEDLRSKPLIERKQILKDIVPEGSLVRYSDHVEEKGEDLFSLATKQGLEGMIAKDGNSPYAEGVRGSSWLKIKTSLRQETVIAGFTEPRGSRKSFGALVLGAYKDGKLQYIGHTGTGFNDRLIKDVYAKMRPLLTKRSPFENAPKTNMPVTWVKPELVAEIKFTEWTAGGNMRHPVFVGLRTDKPAKDVRRENPEPVEKEIKKEEGKASGSQPKLREGSSDDKIEDSSLTRRNSRTASKIQNDSNVKLTHLEKVFWPKDGYTKGDLIDYYRTMAPVMLPHLKDRPESLNRHPNGIEGKSFFQKNIATAVPPFVKTVRLASESQGSINWLLCQNEDTLLYLANLGCIEINPWNSRYQTPEHPDYLIIDLDPDDNNSFDEVVALALLTKKILDKAGVESYPKTSGKSGIHIFVPLKAKYTQDEARMFGEIVANLVHSASPKNTSVIRDPKQRKGKIYVDFLQNRIGQTIAAPYSVRPWPGATVSAPLKWSEVKKGLHPSKFTIKNMPKRVEKMGDLWCPVQGKGIDLRKALKNLSPE